MKNIFKYAYSALVGVAALTAVSCTDKYEYDGRGEWNASADYANIYFPVTTQSVELDPVDPTTATIQVMRRNTNGALSVPFEVTRNTDNVFTVGQANFAAGDSIANIEVSFPNAEVGKPYTLQLTLNDPSYVSKYSEDIIYTFDVTRVKWNDVGFYYDENGNKVEGWCMYTDDFVTGIYGVQNLTYPVQVQERDDQPGVFRIKNAYDGKYGYNDPGDWDENTDYYMIINASNPQKVYFEPYAFELGMVWSYGAFIVRHLAGYNEENGKDGSDYYGTYENGAITFPKQSFHIGMTEYNGGGYRWYANANGKFKLVINPDLDLYTATPNDYDWELVFEGIYTSEKLGTTTDGVGLYKGVQKAEVEEANPGCYTRFEETYGTPYLIASPYASGKHLVFCVKEDGTVTTPIESQDLGFKAVGEEVYGRIRGGGSTFTEKEITLRIVFENADGSVEYGTADETLANIKWNQVGTGTYTYTFLFADEDEEGNSIPVEDPDLPLYQREDKPEVFKIGSWGFGSEFEFTWDEKTGKVTVPGSYTGYEDSTYGSVYVSDWPNFNSNRFSYTDHPCSYDAGTSTFSFDVIYFVSAGGFGGDVETFKVNWSTTSRTKATARQKPYKKSKKVRNESRIKWSQPIFVGKKVNRKALINTPSLIK